MVEPVEKSKQVLRLEGVLQRPLWPCLTDDVRGRENRKCYQLDEHGNITGLNLAQCDISDGSFLRELSGLTSLSLSGTNISDWSFLRELSGLTSLDLYNASISDGAFLVDLLSSPTLRTLNLEGNSLCVLPSEIFKLNIRIEIECQQMLGSVLPQSINLFGNPLESPPLEIVQRGHADLMAWFREQAAEVEPDDGDGDDDIRPLEEVKVILLGDGKAGKTSLRKRLMGELVDRNEQQTRGLELQKWDVDVDDWEAKTGERTVKVHFWDFGGQVINHSTHQFFLSRRSLYIVVLDNRKDEDAEYWLKMIETFGGDSPVLVIMNKIDEHPGFDVNRSFLADKYAGVEPDRFFRLSCFDDALGDGIDRLKQALLRELAQVDMVRSPWPRRWRNVKQHLEDRNDDYIEYTAFQQTCVDCGITEEDSQKALVGYLSDLGIALYFPEFGVGNLQVLNPRWATQAVYRIINAQQLADGKGVLSLECLHEILRKTLESHFEYPGTLHPYVVNLMKKFEVCYELNPKTILVPDLLEVAEPPVEFPTDNLLRFRYEYDFLPRSVLPRFIVRWHADIDDELRWRTGVVVTDEELDARAVVKSDIRDGKIMIDVAGRDRREYFRRIRAEFRKIHDTFAKLSVTEKVPLPDAPGYDVKYSDLLMHERRGRSTILIGDLNAEYEVRSLLDGIERPEDRLRDPSNEDFRGSVDRRPPGDGPAKFDVFLSHNSLDKADVRTLNEKIKQRGLRTWLDEEQLKFGDSLSEKLQEILDSCGSAIVCIGPNGFGPWHKEEEKVLTTRRVDANRKGESFRIIPLYLPSAPSDPEVPAFLRDPRAVDLRSGWSDDVLDRLRDAVSD